MRAKSLKAASANGDDASDILQHFLNAVLGAAAGDTGKSARNSSSRA